MRKEDWLKGASDCSAAVRMSRLAQRGRQNGPRKTGMLDRNGHARLLLPHLVIGRKLPGRVR